MKPKKIIAVTGARSDYDLLFSVYQLLNNNELFDFRIIVTGSHLSEEFGYTVQYIEKDGFKIEDQIFNLINSNNKIGRVISLGNQIPALAQAFFRLKPDIVLIAGDREEALSTSIAAAYMDIPVAHFFGGDVALDGNIDNSVRYATSKLSHIHFPTLEEHKINLLKLGEDEWRIHVVGNPALDRLLNTVILPRTEISKYFNSDINNSPYFVLIQHSIITEVEKQAEHIRITLDAIVENGTKCFINYPNSDPGNYEIINAYKEYCEKYPNQLKLFQNLDRNMYVNLLRQAQCLIGNSSSGILEAPSLGLPAVNIGNRQRGRIHGNNVIFVDNNKQQILEALKKVQTDSNFIAEVSKNKNPYGDGNSAGKVIQVLANAKIDPKLIHKNITYNKI